MTTRSEVARFVPCEQGLGIPSPLLGYVYTNQLCVLSPNAVLINNVSSLLSYLSLSPRISTAG